MSKEFKASILAPLVTIGIFVLTKNSFTGPFSLQMTLISLLALIVYGAIVKKRGQLILETSAFVFLFYAFVLFLVASTGWFFSPFFFALYLLAILLAFVFDIKTSLGFVITLVVLFSFNIGEVDLTYDFLVVLSLLTVVPLSVYLRREYLRLREAEKKILVLEKEGDTEGRSKVEEILANKVNNFAVNLRQPMNDVKQLAHRLENVKSKESFDKTRQRILASIDESLRMLKSFEEEVTGKKLLTTPGEASETSVESPVSVKSSEGK